MSGFNGGKSQLQGAGIAEATSYPFLNMFKMATRWAGDNFAGVALPSTLDTNGYPINFVCVTGTANNISAQFWIPSQNATTGRPGNYVAIWSGSCTIGLNGTSSPASASFTASITGTVLTVSGITGTIAKGQTVVGAAANTVIGAQLTGTAGGNGTYQVSVSQSYGPASTTSSSGSLTSSGSGRFLLIPSGSQINPVVSPVSGGSITFPPFINFSVAASGFTSISNVVFCHVDDEALINSGQIFGTKFLSTWAALGAGVIRFSDWVSFNTTNCTTWATRKPTTYFSYASYELRESLYVGIATYAAGDAYGVTTPGGYSWPGYTGGAPVDKQTIITYSPTLSSGFTPTLNLNGSGPIPILSPYGTTLPSLGIKPGPTPGGAGQAMTFIYDAALNGWLMYLNVGLDGGIPPEVCLQMAVAVGAHPHFCTPYLTLDPPTDYNSSHASYMAANKPSWMVPRYEGPNECWNTSSGTYVTAYSGVKAALYWNDTRDQFNNWYGAVAMINLAAAIAPAFGNNFANYALLCGARQSDGTVATNDAARLNSRRRLSSRICTFNSGNGVTAQITDVGNGYPTGTPFQIVINQGSATWPAPLQEAGQPPFQIYYVLTAGDTFTFSATLNGSPVVYTNANTFGASFTASITGTVMTVSGISGKISTGQIVVGAAANTIIGSQITGTAGSNGTYNVSVSQSYGPTATTSLGPTYTIVCDQPQPALGVSHLCTSTYVNPSETEAPAELTRAYNYYVNGDATQIDLFVDSMTTNAGNNLSNLAGCLAEYTGYKALAQTYGVQKMCAYEGGYSTSAGTTDFFSPISGATVASSCVLTLATTTCQNFSGYSGNPAFSPLPLYITGVVGATELNCIKSGVALNAATGVITWTGHGFSANQAVSFESNGLPNELVLMIPYYVVGASITTNTFQVSATPGGAAITSFTGTLGSITGFQCWVVSAVFGNSVTINKTTTNAYVSGGTATYVGSAQLISNFRLASKASTHIQGYTFGGYLGSQSNYGNFVGLTGGGFVAEYPSQYDFASPGGTWATWWISDIYSTPSPAYAGIAAFNRTVRLFTLTT